MIEKYFVALGCEIQTKVAIECLQKLHCHSIHFNGILITDTFTLHFRITNKMTIRGLCKCSISVSNIFTTHVQRQVDTPVKTRATYRPLSSNPPSNDPQKKVHQAKQPQTVKAPLWHKLIPFKSWQNKAANTLKPAVAVLNLHGMIAADMGGGGGIGEGNH